MTSWIPRQATQSELETWESVLCQVKSSWNQQRQFHVYRFILTQALLLPIHTLKLCRHHRLMHVGKISQITEVPTKKKNQKKWKRCVCALLASESPDRDAALEHHAVNGPGEGRGSLEKSVGWSCNRLYTLYTAVAAVEGGKGRWAVTMGSLTFPQADISAG